MLSRRLMISKLPRAHPHSRSKAKTSTWTKSAAPCTSIVCSKAASEDRAIGCASPFSSLTHCANAPDRYYDPFGPQRQEPTAHPYNVPQVKLKNFRSSLAKSFTDYYRYLLTGW